MQIKPRTYFSSIKLAQDSLICANFLPDIFYSLCYTLSIRVRTGHAVRKTQSTWGDQHVNRRPSFLVSLPKVSHSSWDVQ